MLSSIIMSQTQFVGSLYMRNEPIYLKDEITTATSHKCDKFPRKDRSMEGLDPWSSQGRGYGGWQMLSSALQLDSRSS